MIDCIWGWGKEGGVKNDGLRPWPLGQMMVPLTEIRNTEGFWFRLHHVEFLVLGTLDWSHSVGSWLSGAQEVNLG